MKHGPKGDKAVRKAEKSGQEVQIVKKGDHANKNNQMEARKMAMLINEEEDRKRNDYLMKLLQCLRTYALQSRRQETPRDGHRNSLRIWFASPSLMSTLGKPENQCPLDYRSPRWTKCSV